MDDLKPTLVFIGLMFIMLAFMASVMYLQDTQTKMRANYAEVPDFHNNQSSNP